MKAAHQAAQPLRRVCSDHSTEHALVLSRAACSSIEAKASVAVMIREPRCPLERDLIASKTCVCDVQADVSKMQDVNRSASMCAGRSSSQLSTRRNCTACSRKNCAASLTAFARAELFAVRVQGWLSLPCPLALGQIQIVPPRCRLYETRLPPHRWL